MGREAVCRCNWAGADAEVKVLIEPPHLILRGGVRRRLALADLKQVRAEGDALCFTFESESVSIALGSALAGKWAKAITAPPPTLAKKLGIDAGTIVRLVGAVDDAALEDALTAAKAVSSRKGELIVARVGSHKEMARALKSCAGDLAGGVPVWFVYPKGRGRELGENEVRELALAVGIVDTKVAAVSERLTALRFVKRRNVS